MESAMDTDEIHVLKKPSSSEDYKSEEGELSDEDLSFQPAEPQPLPPQSPKQLMINKPAVEVAKLVETRVNSFITGIDVFGKEEQARLVERAKRFGLDSSQTNLLSQNQLKKLYKSVGVKEGDDKEFRFDSIRMQGTEAMSTQDVFEFFKDYAPTSIEWIDDESCNVVWIENLSAIRALIGLSKPIKNLSKFQSGKAGTKNTSDKTKTKVKNKEHSDDSDSDVIMIEDENNSKQVEEQWEEELAGDTDAIDAFDLNLEIPPGMWRKGNTHPNSDGILLRFCPRQPESKKLTDESKRLPQPVFGVVGLLSKSRKQRMKDGLIVRPKMFEDDVGDDRDFIISSDEDDGKNPWGTLAKSWSNIDRSREPPMPSNFGDDVFRGHYVPPPLPPVLGRLPPTMPLPPQSILNRVGIKPSSSKHTSHGRFSRFHSRSPSPEESSFRPSLHRRLQGKRHHTKENDSEDSAFSDRDSSDADNWTRKSKIPRMRMYADEEEVKVKQRTKLQAQRKLSPSRSYSRIYNAHGSKNIDLRSRLEKDNTSSQESGKMERKDRQIGGFSRVERSPPPRHHSRAKHKLMSVASSVWTKMSDKNHVKIKQEKDSEESDSSCSESDQSSFSNSEENEVSDIQNAGQSSSEDNEKKHDKKSSSRVDLRSRINKGSSSKPVKSTVSSSIFKKRSPLRIEIDNDQYCQS